MEQLMMEKACFHGNGIVAQKIPLMGIQPAFVKSIVAGKCVLYLSPQKIVSKAHIFLGVGCPINLIGQHKV